MTDWYTYSCSCETKLCNRFSNWKVWVIYAIQFSHAGNSGPVSSKCLKDQRPHEYSAQVKDPTTATALMQISFCRSEFAYFYTKTRGIAPICMYLVTYLVTFLKFLILKFRRPPIETSHATCTATYLIGYLLLLPLSWRHKTTLF